MKSILSFAALLLDVSSVFASPVQDEQGGAQILVAPDFKGDVEAKPSSCSSGFTLTLTEPVSSATPVSSFDFFTFCSAFLQPTATVLVTTYITVTSTSIIATTTAYVETTQTITSKGTVTSLCPAASASPTDPVCGVAAWGYASNNIHFAQPLSPYDCHQLCLQDEACNSFQTQNSSYPDPQCNLYNTTAASNNTIVGAAPFLFYDWDCKDYLPAQCEKIVTTIVTIDATLAPRAPLPTAPARLNQARAVDAEAYATLPSFLAPFGSSSITDVCNCIIESPSPAFLVTKTTGISSGVSASVTATSYVVFTVTDRVGFVTSVSSVD